MTYLAAAVIALITSSAAPEVDPYANGVSQYEARQYRRALESFTAALDRAPKRRSKGNIHLYVGLIQLRYGLEADALSSFRTALSLEPKLELPDPGFIKALTLYRDLQREMSRTQTREKPKSPRPRTQRASSKKRVAKARPARTTRPATPRQMHTADSPEQQKRRIEATERQMQADGSGATKPPADPAPVQLTLPAPPPSPDAVHLPDLNEEVEIPSDGLNYPAWALFSAGVTGVVTGAIFQGLAISNQKAAADAEQASRTVELTDRFRTQEQIGWVSLGLGTALTTGAIVWLLTE